MNVAWNWDSMGDAEYMLACQHHLIPIATEVCEISLRKLLAGISSDSEVAIWDRSLPIISEAKRALITTCDPVLKNVVVSERRCKNS